MTFITNDKRHMISSYMHSLTTTYQHLSKHPTLPLVYQNNWDNQNIPILSGGGSGHEPAHVGFVGQGMLTGAIFGPLFTPPHAADILEAIRFLDRGKGIFIIIKNFEADVKNFRTAIEQARKEGHSVKYVISHDDISIEPNTHFQIRSKGLAGTILLHKIVGYFAQQGYTLDQLETIGLDVATQIATIGFATKSATLPNAALPLFDLDTNAISYGIGIHGEEGYRTVTFQSSELLANEIINKLKLHFHWKPNHAFVLLVNNLGTTTDLEMGIFLHDILQLLDIEGIHPLFIKSGKYMTSLDMTGISVTLFQLSDMRWLEALQAETNAFAW